MTAIAYRGGIMAADAAEGNSRISVARVKKIRRAGGMLVALAGEGTFERSFIAWLLAGGRGRFEEGNADDFDALVAMPSGQLRYYRGNGLYIPLDVPFYALGSADIFLTGAMAAGASAPAAVELATDYMANIRGPIQVEHLHS